jgi:GT2 family glycosyltransferase
MTDAVGVIVVTYNSRAHFARLKAALEAQTAPYRLLVIDNASEPAQRPAAADFPAHAEIVQMATNTGFAVANNMGVARLAAPLAALLNPDAFPEPDWLATLLAAAAQHPDAAAFGSTQVAADNPAVYDGLGDCYHVFGIPWRGGYGWPIATPRKDGEAFSACAAAMLVRCDAWRAVGGFDETYFSYCEDVDLGFRLRLAGWRVRQAAAAVVHHVGGGSADQRSEFALYHGVRNRLWTFVKDMPGWAFWLFAPAHAAITAYLLWRAQSQDAFAANWRGVKDALRGIGPVWRERQRVQRARRASVLTVLAAMAWSPRAVSRRAPVVKVRKS